MEFRFKEWDCQKINGHAMATINKKCCIYFSE